jgi:hypothetical protein
VGLMTGVTSTNPPLSQRCVLPASPQTLATRISNFSSASKHAHCSIDRPVL